MIRISDLEANKKAVNNMAKKRLETLISLPRPKKFGIQQIISTVLAEKLPLPLKRIFK